MPGEKQPRLVIVYGTPCGGTGYTAQRLRAAGFDVAHEGVGRDGIVCGFAWMDVLPRSLDRFEFAVKVRLIRSPLSVLETLPNFAKRIQHARRDLPVPEDPTEAALFWWVTTHETMPDDFPVLRVEHFDDDFPAVVNALNAARPADYVPPTPDPDGRVRPVPKPKPRSKPSRWPLLAWADLHDKVPELAARALAIATKYDVAEEPEPRVFPDRQAPRVLPSPRDRRPRRVGPTLRQRLLDRIAAGEDLGGVHLIGIGPVPAISGPQS